MPPLVAALLLFMYLLSTDTDKAHSITGLATYYAPGVIEIVLNNRGIVPREVCPSCNGIIALQRKEDIGRVVWLSAPGGPIEGPYLVVDCAGGNMREILRRGWVVDLSYDIALRWQERWHALDTPVAGVTVYYEKPDLDTDTDASSFREAEEADEKVFYTHPSGLPLK